MNYKGKVALITGSARGIGSEIAIEFAKRGADIILNDLKISDTAKKTMKCIENEGRRVIFCVADVCDRSQVEDMFKKSFNEFGHIDILVNNAGISRMKPFLELTDDDWDIVMDVNLKSMFIVTQEAFRYMMKNKSSRIVNISSMSGQIAGPTLNYAVSKAGVISLTKCTARYGAKYNIHVNAVAPGMLLTDMTKDEIKTPLGKAQINMSLLKKAGLVSDVVEAVMFLASFEESYITAHVLNVNGGTQV